MMIKQAAVTFNYFLPLSGLLDFLDLLLEPVDEVDFLALGELVWLSGDLDLARDFWLSGDLEPAGDLWLSDDLDLAGDVWLSGDLEPAGDVSSALTSVLDLSFFFFMFVAAGGRSPLVADLDFLGLVTLVAELDLTAEAEPVLLGLLILVDVSLMLLMTTDCLGSKISILTAFLSTVSLLNSLAAGNKNNWIKVNMLWKSRFAISTCRVRCLESWSLLLY